MNTDKLPYISVIITAYNRREYLLNAIKSAFNQTLPKDKYEIIIIKNFQDIAIDDFINKNNINNILMDGTVGEFLYAGITASKGKIISFLDDDDLFANNKLEIVYDKFKNNDNLVYYHNDNIPVNHNYEKLGNNRNRGIAFNMSSISIKKEIININNIKEIDSSQDHFMYLSALESNKKIIKGKEKLTYYMYHNSYSNLIIKDFNKFKNYKMKYINQELNLYLAFKEMFASNRSISYINAQIANCEIDVYFYGSGKKPDNVINVLKTRHRTLDEKIVIFLSYLLVRIDNNLKDTITKHLWYDLCKKCGIN